MHRSHKLLTFLTCGFAAATLTGCAGPRGADGLPRDAQDDAGFATASERPPTPATLFVMARILAAQGREPECRYVLERILQQDPSYTPAYAALAEHHMRMGRSDDAIKAIESGLGRAPKDPVLLNNLGMIHMIRAEYAKAIDQFSAAAGIAPGDAGYRANLAAALGMSGRYEESLATYAQVMPQQDAHYNLAVVCEAIGDQTRAKAEFAAAESPERDAPRRGDSRSPSRPAPQSR
jgi:tetratricopeptide (TPR) repeat protein